MLLCLNRLTIIIGQTNELEKPDQSSQVPAFNECQPSTPKARRSKRLAESSSKQTPTMLGKRPREPALQHANKIRPLNFGNLSVQKPPAKQGVLLSEIKSSRVSTMEKQKDLATRIQAVKLQLLGTKRTFKETQKTLRALYQRLQLINQQDSDLEDLA